MTDHAATAFRVLARAHLRTRVERAVFAVVSGAAGRWWTASAAARAARVNNIDADQTLRRFAAAGIVEEKAGSAGRRYRYRAEMDYLTTEGVTDGNGELRDPVCGMPVAADTPHVAHDHGRVVRFCSIPCQVRWQRAQRSRHDDRSQHVAQRRR